MGAKSRNDGVVSQYQVPAVRVHCRRGGTAKGKGERGKRKMENVRKFKRDLNHLIWFGENGNENENKNQNDYELLIEYRVTSHLQSQSFSLFSFLFSTELIYQQRISLSPASESSS